MDNINSSKTSKTTFPQYKTLVDEYWSSDVAWDRSTFVSYNINGRVWWKHGQRPAVTYFGKIYKVNFPDKFDTSRQYMMEIGMARQSTKELQVSKQEGVEIAAEHAVTQPIAVMYFEKKPMRKDFNALISVFRKLTNDNRVVMTREELNAEKDFKDAYNAFIEDIDNYKDENCCNEQKCKKSPLIVDDSDEEESNILSTSDKGVDCYLDHKHENSKKSPYKYSDSDVATTSDKTASSNQKKDETTKNKDQEVIDAINGFYEFLADKNKSKEPKFEYDDDKIIELLQKIFHM